jgi:hypothetical protein
MPLLDHFHPPLKGRRHWGTFHGRWTASIMDALNFGGLPVGYFAEMQVTLTAQVEVDVATLEEAKNGKVPPRRKSSGGGRQATLAAPAWAPPAPQLEMAAVFPDDIEVLVFRDLGGPTLVAAIELVSPGNKDRPAARRAFATKCLAYLQRGIGLVVVDVVTERQANLHDEIARVSGRSAPRFPGSPPLYAAAYRPYRREKDERVAIWVEKLALGQPLPAMPLWLRGELSPVRLDLEATYTEAREKCLLP